MFKDYYDYVTKAKDILSRYGMQLNLYSAHSTIGMIKRAGDPLTEKEHIVLFDAYWAYHHTGELLPEGLKLKIVRNRARFSYWQLLEGDIMTALKELKRVCTLTEREEVILWRLFQKTHDEYCTRDCDRLNYELDSCLYNYVTKKFRMIGKAKVLDIGCGSIGAGISTLSARYQGRISGFGVDLHINEHPGNVNLVIGNIRQLPFANNTFDVAYSSHVLQWIKNDDKPKVLKEVMRVLKKGGYFLFDDSSKHWEEYRETYLPRSNTDARIIQLTQHCLVLEKP